ncbi:DUF4259 domain-containing protein [Catellatospora methionotrophica]|uniref:DUF4259 domain-containing protein n=1 Tax=Catellatospora methionotrophica TaxID=121620 RepID=UPI0033E0F162
MGPFDNDDAAYFAGDLDEATPEARVEMVGCVVEHVATAADDPHVWDAPRAVAAAALIAAQCVGGEPVCSNYGPKTPMPQFPDYLTQLAIDALDRVVTTSWLADWCNGAVDGSAWRRAINDLRMVLEPAQTELLFDL